MSKKTKTKRKAKRKTKPKASETPPKMVMFAEVELGGETYKMPITFGVSRALNQAGHSPTDWAAQAYDAKVRFKANIPDHVTMAEVLHIGASEDGCEMTVEEIGEEIIKGGMEEYAVIIGFYMAGFINGGLPEHVRASDMLDLEKKAAGGAGK